MCRAIEPVSLSFFFPKDVKPTHSLQENLKGAVWLFLGVCDLPETTDVEGGRVARHQVDAVRAYGDHPDLVRPRKYVADHLAIARFEKGEGDRDLG